MANERIENPVTGQILQRKGRGWIDVTPTANELAAQGSNPLEAFGVSAANTALNIFESLGDLGAQAHGRPGLSAMIRQQSTERNALLHPLRDTNPISTFFGSAAVEAPLAFAPMGGARLLSIMGREAALGGGLGFVSRPGTMAERVQSGIAGAAFSAAGAGAMGVLSSGARTARTMTRQADEFSGSVDLELSSRNIDLEAETNVPRLGEAMQREYDRLASRATLPADSPPGRMAGDIEGGTTMDPWRRELIRQADDLGIALTTGDRIGSRSLKKMEAGLASNPLTSRPWDQLKDFNRRRVNDLALDAIGETPGAGEISGRHLGNAHERIGADFQEVASRIGSVSGDKHFFDAIDAAAAKHQRGYAGSGNTAAFTARIRAAFDIAEDASTGGAQTGQQLMDGRSMLTKELQKHAIAGDGNTMQGIYELITAIDELMLRNSDVATVGLYSRARGQWRILDALEQGQALGTDGDVRALSLDSILRRRYPVEYQRAGVGASPLFDAVKVLSTFKDVVGDSGTATRLATQSFMDQPVQTIIKGVSGATAGRAVFSGTQSRTGSMLFQGGLLANPSRSAARLGTLAGVAAAGEAQQPNDQN